MCCMTSRTSISRRSFPTRAFSTSTNTFREIASPGVAHVLRRTCISSPTYSANHFGCMVPFGVGEALGPHRHLVCHSLNEASCNSVIFSRSLYCSRNLLLHFTLTVAHVKCSRHIPHATMPPEVSGDKGARVDMPRACDYKVRTIIGRTSEANTRCSVASWGGGITGVAAVRSHGRILCDTLRWRRRWRRRKLFFSVLQRSAIRSPTRLLGQSGKPFDSQ